MYHGSLGYEANYRNIIFLKNYFIDKFSDYTDKGKKLLVKADKKSEFLFIHVININKKNQALNLFHEYLDLHDILLHQHLPTPIPRHL